MDASEAQGPPIGEVIERPSKPLMKRAQPKAWIKAAGLFLLGAIANEVVHRCVSKSFPEEPTRIEFPSSGPVVQWPDSPAKVVWPIDAPPIAVQSRVNLLAWSATSREMTAAERAKLAAIRRDSPDCGVVCIWLKNQGPHSVSNVVLLFDPKETIIAHDLGQGISLSDSEGHPIKDSLRHFAYRQVAEIHIPNIPSEMAFEVFFLVRENSEFYVSCRHAEKVVQPVNWSNGMSIRDLFGDLFIRADESQP